MNKQDHAALQRACRGDLAIFESIVPLETLAEIKARLDPAYDATPDHKQFYGSAKDVVHTLRDIPAFGELESESVRLASDWLDSAMKAKGTVGPWFGLRVGSSTSTSGSHCRHFDSHVLTLVILLQAAVDDDRAGDLVAYTKPRRLPGRSSNLVAKSVQWTERNMPFPLRAARTQRHLDKGICTRIKGKPGSVYVFNGFLMQHCNLDVLAGQRRSLIIHYLDPGLSMGLSAVNRFRRDFAAPTDPARPVEPVAGIDAT
ncbi:hypothetical protein [Caballeronia ptereochthonis]|uniref:Phytanoyl-CoA dioxygenase (PhyH) n=1 Tax=Caballeronia ptereochthonis TaxID=1777144 RepID=A0A158AAZ6_9BURK|nr:hypothetical protein [Caballeronia ptereochthonis]SAK54865.1 hypothetical protein AWB83_01569 [Caballeronia ptereochthonis]